MLTTYRMLNPVVKQHLRRRAKQRADVVDSPVGVAIVKVVVPSPTKSKPCIGRTILNKNGSFHFTSHPVEAFHIQGMHCGRMM